LRIAEDHTCAAWAYMYDVTRARPVRHEAARVCTTYTRDQLLLLYMPTRPIAAVTARLRSFNLYTVCRLHVQRRRPHRLYDRPVVGCYRGCRAGRTRRRLAIVRPTACGAGILVSSSPSRHVARLPPLPSSLISVNVDRHPSPQRGTRGGVRCARPRPVLRLRSVNNGAYVVHSIRRQRPSRHGAGSVKSNILPIRTLRHTESSCRALKFGSLNVRSLSSTKVDSLLIEIRERPIDVLLLCETWHDADSVSIRRLRAEGLSVVERARLRSRQADASLAVNHGGGAVVATAGIRLTSINTGVKPSTFECIAARYGRYVVLHCLASISYGLCCDHCQLLCRTI